MAVERGGTQIKSPRFDARSAPLKALFTSAKLKAVWKDKVRLSMRDQILRDPIEHFDVTISIDAYADALSSNILSGDYKPSLGYRVHMEKSRGLCRQIVVPQPQDAIALQILSDALHPTITAKAPTKKSFYRPQDQAFSKSLTGYGSFFAWINFQKAILKFSKNNKFLVVTDIANYYDSISYTHLRNVLAGISGTHEVTLDMLLFVLSGLLWQPDYLPRIDIGLPQIDLDAPRLLAHCFLFELDSHLDKLFDGDFARYMDDIDVGVNTIAEAKRAVKEIDLILQTRQVRLNSGKTRILTQSEAEDYFKIWDNLTIDALKGHLNFRVSAGLDISTNKKWISKRISTGLDVGDFDDGHGDKILKRLINLATQYEVNLGSRSPLRVLAGRPSLRSEVYRYLSGKKLTASKAKIIQNFIKSDWIIDHAAPLEIATHLNESLIESRREVKAVIDDIVARIGDGDSLHFYASLWIQSKYGSRNEIITLCKKHVSSWAGDVAMGRLIGGLYPIFFDTPEWLEFKKIIESSRNDGSRAVYKFHESISTRQEAFDAMYPYLKAPNTSKSTGITHSKFLLLLSALRNEKVPMSKRSALKAANAMVWKDVYYRRIARRILKAVP